MTESSTVRVFHALNDPVFVFVAESCVDEVGGLVNDALMSLACVGIRDDKARSWQHFQAASDKQ